MTDTLPARRCVVATLPPSSAFDEYATAAAEARVALELARPDYRVRLPRLPTPSVAWWAALAMVGAEEP